MMGRTPESPGRALDPRQSQRGDLQKLTPFLTVPSARHLHDSARTGLLSIITIVSQSDIAIIVPEAWYSNMAAL